MGDERHQIASVSAIGRFEFVGALGRFSRKTLGAVELRKAPDTFLLLPRFMLPSLGGKKKGSSILLRCQAAPGCLARGTRTARHLGLSLQGLAVGLIGPMVVRIFCVYLCHLWVGVREGCDLRVGTSSCGKAC